MSSLSIGDFARWTVHPEVDYVFVMNVQGSGYYGIRVSLTSPPEIRGRRVSVHRTHLEKIDV